MTFVPIPMKAAQAYNDAKGAIDAARSTFAGGYTTPQGLAQAKKMAKELRQQAANLEKELRAA